VLAFSSLCVGTLDELRASWQAVDGMVHVNRFRRFEDYQRLCAASGLEQLELQRRPHVLHYPDVRSLTHELKALGAHNLNPGRPSGLTGRARMQGLLQAYEQFRQPQGCRRPIKWSMVCCASHRRKGSTMSQAYFIAGTDTDVGKTTIAAGLLHAARLQGMSTLAPSRWLRLHDHAQRACATAMPWR
jgi:hypothetical protein